MDVLDKLFTSEVALPDGATSTYSADFDLAGAVQSGKQRFTALCELHVSIPALTTVQLPDTKTITFAVCAGASASPTTVIADAILVLTGAGGAGCAAAVVRFHLPTDVARYVRIKATAVATVAGSTANMTVTLRF